MRRMQFSSLPCQSTVPIEGSNPAVPKKRRFPSVVITDPISETKRRERQLPCGRIIFIAFWLFVQRKLTTHRLEPLLGRCTWATPRAPLASRAGGACTPPRRWGRFSWSRKTNYTSPAAPPHLPWRHPTHAALSPHSPTCRCRDAGGVDTAAFLSPPPTHIATANFRPNRKPDLWSPQLSIQQGVGLAPC